MNRYNRSRSYSAEGNISERNKRYTDDSPSFIRPQTNDVKTTEPPADANQSGKASKWPYSKIVEGGLRIVFSTALVTVGVLQYTVADKQRAIMDAQTKILAQQQVAAERSSTTGRAWVFFNYPLQGPMPEGTDQSFSVAVRFRLENQGETPAIITGVQLHLFVGDNTWPPVEPDPIAPESLRLQETRQMPIIGMESGVVIDPEFGSNQAIIPAKGSLGVMQATFSFRRAKVEDESAQGNMSLPHLPIQARRMWLYAVIGYKDVFGFNRVTGYYAALSGAMASRPTHSEYNCWDENCPAALRQNVQ